jgi:hypothetical protein
MARTNDTHVLDQLLDPVGRCLTPDVARSLLALRAPPQAQARIEELAGKCTEGRLTTEEESEYDAYVWAGNLIAILQAKARTLLARPT